MLSEFGYFDNSVSYVEYRIEYICSDCKWNITCHFVTTNLDKVEPFENELSTTEDHRNASNSFLKTCLKSVEVRYLNTLQNLGV